MSFTSSQWDALLDSLRQNNAVNTLSELNKLITSEFHQHYTDFNGSDAACVAAILEHEGSIDHYGGTAGPSLTVSINLRRDF